MYIYRYRHEAQAININALLYSSLRLETKINKIKQDIGSLLTTYLLQFVFHKLVDKVKRLRKYRCKRLACGLCLKNDLVCSLSDQL